MLKKNLFCAMGLYVVLGIAVFSLGACGGGGTETVASGKTSEKEAVTDSKKEDKKEAADEKNMIAEFLEEATEEVWVNTKITVYDSEDTSATPRTMTEMTYDEEGRLLTKYVTDYVMAQEPFVKETEEYEYDANGNILKSLSINEVYGLSRYETYRYDENGNKTVYMGDDSTVVFYEYDGNGLLVAERAHMADPAAMGDRTWAMDNPGDVRKEILYTYNDAGQLIEKREPSDHFEDNWFEYFYDEAGNLIEERNFYFGQNSSMKVYDYDENGNCLREEDVSLTGDTSYDVCYECQYSEENVCISRKVFMGGELGSETTYNDNGDILTFISYDDGEISNELHYEYDEEGREIRLEYVNSIESGVSEYEYDKNGNRKCGRSYDNSGNLTGYSVYEYEKIK